MCRRGFQVKADSRLEVYGNEVVTVDNVLRISCDFLPGRGFRASSLRPLAFFVEACLVE